MRSLGHRDELEVEIERTQRRSATRMRYLLSAALILLGVVIVPVVTVVAGFDKVGDMGPYWRDGPGEIVVQVTHPGEQTIWHESGYRVGMSFRSTDEKIDPALLPRVIGPDDAPVPVSDARGNFVRMGPVQRQSVAEFTAPMAGTYRVILDERSAGRRFSVSEPIEPRAGILLAIMLGAVIASAALLFGGVALAAWTTIRLFISHRQARVRAA